MMNEQERNDQILSCVSLKAAAETMEKNALPEEIIEKAQVIYNLHTAWLNQLKDKREAKEKEAKDKLAKKIGL